MQEKEKGIKSTTAALMIITAVFFDVLQWLAAFIFMDWLVGFFAFMTFLLWFWMHGIKFMKPKRIMAMGGAGIIEAIPVLSVLPGWTVAVAYLALEAKVKEKVGGIVEGGGASNVIPFKPRIKQEEESTDDLREAA